MDPSTHESTPYASAEPNRPKASNARSIEDIIKEFGPASKVYYEPFQVESPPRAAKALLPLNFPKEPYPFDYFTLLFTPDLFRTITTNTNQYANQKRLHIGEERLREWTDLLLEELYVFIGLLRRRRQNVF
jgi:hypothetical protein